MTKESAEEFVNRMTTDSDLKEELLKCKSKSEMEQYLEKEGFSFTQKEVEKLLEERAGRKLSEEELAQFAAGSANMPSSSTDWSSCNV